MIYWRRYVFQVIGSLTENQNQQSGESNTERRNVSRGRTRSWRPNRTEKILNTWQITRFFQPGLFFCVHEVI